MRALTPLAAIFVLLLSTGLYSIPRPAAAQDFGGYADRLIFSVVPQDQAIAAISSGYIDMYIFPLDTATDKQAARDNPDINVKEAFTGFRGMFVNPVAPSSGAFNPFTIRDIREAMHWAYDREFIVREIAGGFAIPMTFSPYRVEPNYVRDAAFFAGLEITYGYDPARAKAQVDAAMSRVSGASFDTATNKWLMNGSEIEVIIVQRVEDFRFEIGAYVATVVEALGFTPVLDPSTFEEAVAKVYFSDAKIGQWHLYTEGWGPPGFVQFDDFWPPFFYNGDFASAIWNDYSPPSSLSVACRDLTDGLYVTLEERRDLLRTCVTEGMRDGIRSFLEADLDVHAYSDALSNTAFDLFGGNNNPFAVRTTIKNGVAGGTLNIAQPIHTGSPWNHYGGFEDAYSLYQHFSVHDYGAWNHPHTGIIIPVRATFTVNSLGPTGSHDVPTSALFFNTSTNSFENVSSGLSSKAYVDFDLTFGEWHHGETMSMDDVVAGIAMVSRMAQGDLASRGPRHAAGAWLAPWAVAFRGFEILDEDSVRIWYDLYNPDESLIARQADMFPQYPWELNHIMAESVLANETSMAKTDADLLGREPLDLAKGATFGFFDPRLLSNMANSTIPSFLSAWITPAEATARWAALNEWRNPAAGGCVDGPSIWSCNYLVSQGPYFLNQYFTAPEGAEYIAKREGYPIAQDAWDFLGTVRLPRVTLGTPPQVIQTFPATFQFTTTLDGSPYDLLNTAAWLVLDPATKNILFSGDAIQGGLGIWNIELTAAQTTALAAGTYELQTIVVGEEAALPVVNTQSFTSLDLASSIIAEVTDVIDALAADLQADVDATTDAASAAINVVNAANYLVNLTLAVAVAALVTGVAGIVGAAGLKRSFR